MVRLKLLMSGNTRARERGTESRRAEWESGERSRGAETRGDHRGVGWGVMRVPSGWRSEQKR